MGVLVSIIGALGVVLAAFIAGLVQLIVALRKQPSDLRAELAEARDDAESYYPRLRDCEAQLRQALARIAELERERNGTDY